MRICALHRKPEQLIHNTYRRLKILVSVVQIRPRAPLFPNIDNWLVVDWSLGAAWTAVYVDLSSPSTGSCSASISHRCLLLDLLLSVRLWGLHSHWTNIRGRHCGFRWSRLGSSSAANWSPIRLSKKDLKIAAWFCPLGDLMMYIDNLIKIFWRAPTQFLDGVSQLSDLPLPSVVCQAGDKARFSYTSTACWHSVGPNHTASNRRMFWAIPSSSMSKHLINHPSKTYR